MKKYKIVKRLIATMLSVSCAFSSLATINAFALSATPKGDADILSPVQPLEEQFEEMLLDASSTNERQMILKKAYQMGIDVEDLSNISLSTSELAILNGDVTIQKNNVVSRAVITAPNSSGSNISTMSTGATVAGVVMPTYALMPTIYKQQTSTYCSAATVYTAGKYFGANPPSQQTIMNFWQSQWGVQYPDLPLIRNYMNLHLPDKPSDYVKYVHKVYGGSQTTFNTDLKNNVLNYQPMILHMRNNSGTTNWPYTTSGHFCICSGLLTWENNKYYIGDPFYFSTYVSGAGTVGTHNRTWSQLNTVITNRHGSGNQAYLT